MSPTCPHSDDGGDPGNVRQAPPTSDIMSEAAAYGTAVTVEPAVAAVAGIVPDEGPVSHTP
jgi:hypothetical protein